MVDCEVQRFEMFQNDTRVLNFKVEDEDGEAITSIEDAQGAIFAMFNADGDEVIRLDLDDGITLAGNVVTVSIPKANGLPVGEYEFELQISMSVDEEQTLAQGGARIKRRLIA